MKHLPIVDVSPLVNGNDIQGERRVSEAIGEACRAHGFFYISGHGVPGELLEKVDRSARKFFALPEDEKLEIRMANAGRAWRGFFPVGGELTSGKPDIKEGIYFGTELPASDPRVQSGLPLHGANLWPRGVPELRPAVLGFMDDASRVAQAVLKGISLSLGLDAAYFERTYTADPTVLFRIFHYPPSPQGADTWGVGEHTDYGLLTLLVQDDCGGLQVKGPQGWIEAPVVPGTIVCNIGDMLDRLTGGYYKSTPHRVRNTSGRDRISFPLFFDPGFSAVIEPLPERATAVVDDATERWDRTSVHSFSGTYGDYLLGKVGKVFPDLEREVLAD